VKGKSVPEDWLLHPQLAPSPAQTILFQTYFLALVFLFLVNFNSLHPGIFRGVAPGQRRWGHVGEVDSLR